MDRAYDPRTDGIADPLRFEREATSRGTAPAAADDAAAALRSGTVHVAGTRADGRALDAAIDGATGWLLRAQAGDGHWVFELEADATIPAEYVLLQHYLGQPDSELETQIAVYLRRTQRAEGGWPLYTGGPFNLSASVKAYFALKAIGDAPAAEHMRRARAAILAHGGASRVNVFTGFLLALFGVVPWRSVPAMPVEIMLLPRWFPFHLSRISYWSRTVLVPLLVLAALKPCARNPRGVAIDELFTPSAPRRLHRVRAPHQARLAFALFAALDALLHRFQRWIPAGTRRRAIARAVDFVEARANGVHGLGAIYPAMANAVMMYDALGVPADDPRVVAAREAIARLVVRRAGEAYCQPCVSPVWDTALACLTLLEEGSAPAIAAAHAGLAWLAERQVTQTVGDWAERRPGVRPGGWPFQYANPHYPDLDDTAVIVIAMDRYAKSRRDAATPGFGGAIARARPWVLGLQSRNGGFGAFDADNTDAYLNQIPFADHGALLDPPTADVTARCVGMLAQLGRDEDRGALDAACMLLRRWQEPDGSWYGRWGMNYVYGTWSVLCALAAAGAGPDDPAVRRAAAWLVRAQNADGGWGEDGASYEPGPRVHPFSSSTPSQTAWALLGLMAAGEVRHDAVRRGVSYLLRTQTPAGTWNEDRFTATGFPRVFYLRYHGYAHYFPLWALARYRALSRGTAVVPPFGL